MITFPMVLLRNGNAFLLEDVIPQAPFPKPALFAVAYDHLFFFLFYMIRMSSFRCMRKILKVLSLFLIFRQVYCIRRKNSLFAVALMFPLSSFKVLKIIFLLNISVASFGIFV